MNAIMTITALRKHIEKGGLVMRTAGAGETGETIWNDPETGAPIDAESVRYLLSNCELVVRDEGLFGIAGQTYGAASMMEAAR